MIYQTAIFYFFFFLMIRRPPRSTLDRSSAASDVYKRQELRGHDVQTLSLNVWHVSENERYEVSKSSYGQFHSDDVYICLLYTSPSPRDRTRSRMPSSA